jgi:hypothetical protein
MFKIFYSERKSFYWSADKLVGPSGIDKWHRVERRAMVRCGAEGGAGGKGAARRQW